MRRYFFSRQGATKEDKKNYLIEEQRSIEKKDQVKILKPFIRINSLENE
jgi:hypothetical protein